MPKLKCPKTRPIFSRFFQFLRNGRGHKCILGKHEKVEKISSSFRPRLGRSRPRISRRRWYGPTTTLSLGLPHRSVPGAGQEWEYTPFGKRITIFYQKGWDPNFRKAFEPQTFFLIPFLRKQFSVFENFSQILNSENPGNRFWSCEWSWAENNFLFKRIGIELW